MRVRADPRIFVGETPGLNGGAGGMLCTRTNYVAVNFGLPLKVFEGGLSVLAHGKRYVEFRDVNLKPESSQARDIHADSFRVEIESGNVHLQTHSIDGDATPLEIADHGINCVRFVIEALGFGFVVKQERLRVSFVCPPEGLLDVSGRMVREADPGVVIPRRVFDPDV